MDKQFQQYALYEQMLICRTDNPEEQTRILNKIGPNIPVSVKAAMGSFHGTDFEKDEVVRVKSDCELLPYLIQPDSLVTLKTCLRFVMPEEIHFLVENAEGKECILNMKEVEHID